MDTSIHSSLLPAYACMEAKKSAQPLAVGLRYWWGLRQASISFEMRSGHSSGHLCTGWPRHVCSTGLTQGFYIALGFCCQRECSICLTQGLDSVLGCCSQDECWNHSQHPVQESMPLLHGLHVQTAARALYLGRLAQART